MTNVKLMMVVVMLMFVTMCRRSGLGWDLLAKYRASKRHTDSHKDPSGKL